MLNGCGRMRRFASSKRVKNLSDNSKSRQPHIPWTQIAGLRDKVIHDYFGINLEIVRAVVERTYPSCDAPLTIS